jgi:sarcosine oxidase subunit beta
MGSGWNTRLFPEKEAEWSPYLKYGVFPGTLIDYWPGENTYLIAGNRFEMNRLEHPARLIPEVSNLLAKHAIRFIPKLAELHVIREFAGLRPVCSVDGLPILGKVEDLESFIVATGTDHYGVSAGMIFGKLISELIIKNTTSEPIDEFSYSRF